MVGDEKLMLRIGFCYMDGTISKKIIREFEVKESYIIEDSIERYSTNEPCIIYRTCIINSVYIQLDDLFRKLLNDNISKIKKEELGLSILNAVEIPEEVDWIEIYKKI